MLGCPQDRLASAARALLPVPASPPPASVASVRPKDMPLQVEKLSPEARAFLGASRAPATIEAYSYHWAAFVRWCRRNEKVELPADPHVVADYAASRALVGVPPEERPPEDGEHRTYAERWSGSMIAQALAAIGLMHEFRGFDSPRGALAVKRVWEGIRRKAGMRPDRKAAISVEELRAISQAYGTSLRDLRDRALLLLGFTAALRRGELVAIKVEDLRPDPKGIRLNLARHFSGKTIEVGTKANQAGSQDEILPVAFGEHEDTCAVRAVRAWLGAAKIEEGFVFRAIYQGKKGQPDTIAREGLKPQTVALIVKDACERLNLDPALYAGHSLRAGLATSAARAKKAPWTIAKKTRHKNLDMLARYIRDAGLFDEDAAEGIGL